MADLRVLQDLFKAKDMAVPRIICAPDWPSYPIPVEAAVLEPLEVDPPSIISVLMDVGLREFVSADGFHFWICLKSELLSVRIRTKEDNVH